MDYEVCKTYKMTSGDFIAKHDPTYVGRNMLGRYFEHPIFGDESGLLLEHADKMHLTFECDVPTDEELGFPTYSHFTVVKI